MLTGAVMFVLQVEHANGGKVMRSDGGEGLPVVLLTRGSTTQSLKNDQMKKPDALLTSVFIITDST